MIESKGLYADGSSKGYYSDAVLHDLPTGWVKTKPAPEEVPTLMSDFYKQSHRVQYPKHTQHVYSTWIPRGTRITEIDEVVSFGIQAFIKKYLIDTFNKYFFERDVNEVCAEYERIIRNTLPGEPDSSHLRKLHTLGYLPLEIRAVPEGTVVPLRVPHCTIENTHPEFFWLTNFLETLFSTEVWHPTTSASIARQYLKILNEFADETCDDRGHVQFQGHDFSMRGMEGLAAGAASGAGHLLSFVGTDTIPAITFLECYYNADVEQELVGCSIPATEHSVECAYGQDEYKTVKHLITETYPDGFVSRVCDTWDFFGVLTDVLPKLKDEILARDGKLVVRPDSGDPADIVCGTYQGSDKYREWREANGQPMTPEEKGTVELLWETFGGTINSKGYKVLDPHIGLIYGDSISLDRARDILQRLKDKGFASSNVVFGIGSFTYQYVTRDTFEQALKTTWVMIQNKGQNVMKDPKTDAKHTKKSLTGRVIVRQGEKGLEVQDGLSLDEWLDAVEAGECVLQPVFVNGNLLIDQSLSDIRARVQETV